MKLIKLIGFAIPATLAGVTAFVLISSDKTSPKPASDCALATSNGTQEKVLKLKAGTTYRFLAKATQPQGGTWHCEFGSIDTAGQYTAPSFQPPWGEDSVTYVDPSGDSTTISLLVSANSSLPESAFPRYIRVPSNWSTSTNPDPTVSVRGGSNASEIHSGNLASVRTVYPSLPIYPSGTVPPLAPAVESCEEPDVPPRSEIPIDVSIPPDAARGANPVALYREASDTILISFPATLPVSSQPLLCALGPVNPVSPVAGTNCNGSMLPFKIVSDVLPLVGPTLVGAPSTGSVVFSAALNAQLEALGLGSLAVGFEVGLTYPTTRQLQQWKQKRKDDLYVCVNGKWTFVGSQTCNRTGNGEFVSPLWLAVLDGYTVNGVPGPNTWGPWQCR